VARFVGGDKGIRPAALRRQFEELVESFLGGTALMPGGMSAPRRILDDGGSRRFTGQAESNKPKVANPGNLSIRSIAD